MGKILIKNARIVNEGNIKKRDILTYLKIIF